MKRSVLIALFVLSVATLAFAQVPGSIGVFADAGGTNCNILDGGSLVMVYMVHVLTDGATAVQFRLDVSATGWMHLGDNITFPTKIGTSITGLSVGYGGCYVGPITIGYVNFFGTNAAPCTRIGIIADPTAPTGEIEGVDCNLPQGKFFPTGGVALVNPDGSCECNVPVNESSWGGIKALYQ